MVSGGWRYCDTCDVPILEREPYYVGIATDASIGHMLLNDPRLLPTYTPANDGVAHFEVCSACLAMAPQLLVIMTLRGADG